jgi:POT family proton-dependent oligopeptide transporter
MNRTSPPAHTLFGHPRAIAVLAGTEFWERVSFHGMQALVVLYMVEHLLLPGHVENVLGFAAFRSLIEAVTGPLSMQALAFQIFGLYIAFVYMAPLLGGWLGDRVLGRRNTVALGVSMMTAGQFALAFEASFLFALGLLIFGAGLTRANLIAQLGSLYGEQDRRRATAFQIYYACVNGGAFVAPLVTGLLAREYSWQIAFAFGGFGMLAGLLIYLAGQPLLPAEQPRTRERSQRAPLDPAERRRVLALALLVPLLMLFWLAQSQVWNVYNIWLRDHVDLVVLGWSMPVPWLQSIDGLMPMASMPLALWWWARQASVGREPDELGKLARGCLVFGLGTAWLGLGHYVFPDQRVPLAWALGFHFISNFGWLFVAPVAMGMFAGHAPPAVRGVMIGVCNLSIFAGSIASGRLGALYETVSPQAFWLLHAALVACGGLGFFAIAPWARRELAGARPV